MRFLKLRTDSKRTRKSGHPYITPLIVDSPRRFAPSRARKETALKRRQCQLICGAHDSGKSRWLTRLSENTPAIWGSSHQPIVLEALLPLSSWIEHEQLVTWYNDQLSSDEAHHKSEWKRLNQQQKADQMADYLLDTGALLFIDDAHKLTGRKAQIARACLLSSKVWIMATSEEGRLPPSIRPIVERRNPQRTQLETDASYDSTQALIWFLVALCIVSGAWEAGAVIGGLQMLGRGRRSTRAE
ncbi:AAA family ATPase [Vibrio sp. Of7-15]|uniref:AAA family ATPase n=1 Tax=Vibrio sp. Of7-15 TaxID=2724879 RepID=UPI001EF2C7EF|nr:AAA family ATPase [Vibrio sp. Of7-15]MCG7500028.1 AAA family ATPase [Vibrio sp. Of7-15]